MHKPILFISSILFSCFTHAQLSWINADSLYGPLPSSVHVFYTEQKIDTGAFRAFYVVADLKDKKLQFTADTSRDRRLTPSQFFHKCEGAGLGEKDACIHPLVVVNCTFFSFETNRSLNVVVKNGELVAFNHHTVNGRGKDTLTYRHAFASAIGINKKRKADVAWTLTDSSVKYPYASEWELSPLKDSSIVHNVDYYLHAAALGTHPMKPSFKKWKMQTAVGGGPVLIQNGAVKITNNEELKFGGKAINDKHPRTAMGYTKDGKLIILVVQGRSESGGGATLVQEAQILKDLGCWEALNLDGGGSSCMLVNGKETIKPSDKEGQRAVPAVFEIFRK